MSNTDERRPAAQRRRRPTTAPSRAAEAILLAQWIDSGLAKRLREQAGLSLAAAGQDVEVDPAAVLKWERGEHRPRGRNVTAYFSFLRELMDRLGVAA